jgi:hypothetical protein
MKNCKDTEEQLAEPAECREESEALKDTVRIAARLIEAAAPPDSYWPGYHAKLREKLSEARRSHVVTKSRAKEPAWITKLFRVSVSVPVPVGLSLILVFTLSLLFFTRTPPQSAITPQVVHVPVEVPVVHEKTVTRVVYRDRKRTTKTSTQTTTASRNDPTLARTQNPASLIGFKPTEEIKLTVIKGGSANEK